MLSKNSMINTKKVSKKQRIVKLWQETKFLEKFELVKDLLLAFFIGGIKKVENELDTWEDTIEVFNDNRLMERIKEIRSRTAKSN